MRQPQAGAIQPVSPFLARYLPVPIRAAGRYRYPNFGTLRHHFAQFQGRAGLNCAGSRCKGGVQMIELVIDVVLFSCMTAFVAGIVITAAHFAI